MEKLIRRSLTAVKYSALGFVLFFLLMKALGFVAGHSNATSWNFVAVAAYSILLFIVTAHYQKAFIHKKEISSSFKVCFLLVMLPSVLLAFGISIGLLYQGVKVVISNGSLLALIFSLPVVIVLSFFAFFGTVVLRNMFFKQQAGEEGNPS